MPPTSNPIPPATPTRRKVTPQSTPTRAPIPPFTPRTPRHGPRPATPDSDAEEIFPGAFSLDDLPKGNLLVVRGCVSTDAAQTPVLLVRKALEDIGAAPEYPYFDKQIFMVTPFHERVSSLSSACYVELRLENPGTEPRDDILAIVKEELEKRKTDWEVRWSASGKGKSDKRMSCRLLNLYPAGTDRSDIPSEHLPLIRAHIEKKGFKVASIFPSFGGPQVVFVLPRDADRFMALGTIDVPPAVSKSRATIQPLKEVIIQRAFELVVTGARDFEGLGDLVAKWARRTAPQSFLEFRSDSQHPDLIIFSMTTWAATSTILKSSELFRAAFPYPTIAPPRLLFDHNSAPLKPTSLGDQVAKGASQVTGSVAALTRQLEEVKSGLAAVQQQQTSIRENQEQMGAMMMSMNNRINETQNAMMVQGRDQQNRSHVIDLQSQLSSANLMLLMSGSNPALADAMRTQIDGLNRDLEEAKGELSNSSRQLTSMSTPAIQPPPGYMAVAPASHSTSPDSSSASGRRSSGQIIPPSTSVQPLPGPRIIIPAPRPATSGSSAAKRRRTETVPEAPVNDPLVRPFVPAEGTPMEDVDEL
ncbi:hypothetical protein FPV67DRAFT_167564 [Lyophyllum atratum]|nr:hypothetical protein FPV67DRAFT_167564 [Lyophyllum atratum]